VEKKAATAEVSVSRPDCKIESKSKSKKSKKSKKNQKTRLFRRVIKTATAQSAKGQQLTA
jgi:hypothetical protein